MSPAPAPDGEVRLCAFRVGRDEMAVDIMRVRGILRPPEVTPLPGAPAGVVGLFQLRGELVSVLDVRARLGLADPGAARRLIAVLDRRRVWGLLVDSVSDVVHAPRSALRPAHEVLPGAAGEIFSGVCQHRGRVLLLLNLHRLLPQGDAGLLAQPRGPA
jgi:purine-binding chemotaxis protein CheW